MIAGQEAEDKIIAGVASGVAEFFDLESLTPQWLAPGRPEKPAARVVLVGDPGSGKTTLLNLLAGTLVPEKGAIRVGDVSVNRLTESEREALRDRLHSLADVDAAAGLVTDQTALIVGSAPNYPFGVVDPIPELAGLAASLLEGRPVEGDVARLLASAHGKRGEVFLLLGAPDEMQIHPPFEERGS